MLSSKQCLLAIQLSRAHIIVVEMNIYKEQQWVEHVGRTHT